MATQTFEILLVSDDTEMSRAFETCLDAMEGVQVTCVGDAEAALREEFMHRHDLIVLDAPLPDAEALELARQLRVSTRRPMLLLAESLAVDEAIEAMRLGFKDILMKPIDPAQAVEQIQPIVENQRKVRDRRRRYHRLRVLTGRILRERRDLRERIDLICQDVVHAYRRLAQEVGKSGILTHD